MSDPVTDRNELAGVLNAAGCIIGRMAIAEAIVGSDWLARRDAAVASRALTDAAAELDDVATFQTFGPGDHPDRFTGLTEAADLLRARATSIGAQAE
jgi:hypothetical protein